MIKKNSWYYPRTEFANIMLTKINMGMFSNFIIFAPRRKGKTAFLLNDLSPLLISNNKIPVYANLWADRLSPETSIITGLKDALKSMGSDSKLMGLLNSNIEKVSFAGITAELPKSPAPPISPDNIILIHDLFKLIADKAHGKEVVFMLDEAQHLVTDPSFKQLEFALRTALDTHSRSITSIFTGSSRHNMSLMINNSDAAFYNFGFRQEFPDLGNDYLEFLSKKLSEINIDVSAKDLSKTFHRFNESPHWMTNVCGVLPDTNGNLKEAEARIAIALAESDNLPTIAKEMSATDRFVYITLSEGKKPFSNSIINAVAKLNESNVESAKSAIQHSLTKMSGEQIVSKIGRGEYVLEKPGLLHELENIKRLEAAKDRLEKRKAAKTRLEERKINKEPIKDKQKQEIKKPKSR